MSRSRNNLSNKKKTLEVKVSDSLSNLEQFSLQITENFDFNSFDVLSVTRVEDDQTYTRRFTHRKVDTQSWRIAADALRFLPQLFRRYKLN
jgi:hypothetical protein